jgi:DNA-binding SARP family transcriptional activator/DNA-binding CsgD family transcriptional regulator
MGTTTRIELCGSLRVELEGERLEDALPGRQGRLLLAFLVLNRDRPVRRDELIDALWSGQGTPQSGDALLRPPLSRLRKALGQGRIEGRGELTLVLPPDAYVDWEAAFKALSDTRQALSSGDARTASDQAQAALAIADRRLLPGLEAEWIDERRRELEDLRVEALEAIASSGAALGGGDVAVAERAARAAVEAAPFRESARAALMEVLRAGGNVAEAMRAYDDLRTMLRDELGTTPSPRVVALHDQLLRADEEPPPPPVATMPAPPPRLNPVPRPAGGAFAPAPALARNGGPEIVERDREMSMIAALLDEAAASSGRVALMEGPAGIGKSRLLAEARARAAATSTLALAARGSELEREFPFGVARQLFETALADPERREQLLSGAAAPARALFETSGEPPAGDASFAALHGLFWLAVNLTADGPLLLAIDDLHHCDRPSLRFIAYLTRRLEGLPILIAATLRTGERAADPALLAEVAQDPITVSLRPRPLTEAAVTELVRERLGPDAAEEFCVACHRATVGNPLLLRQLLTALEADGVKPDVEHASVVRQIGQGAVSRSVLLRLERLGEEAVAVARAVAVLGENADLPAIAGLAGLDDQGVAEASAALARAEILLPERPLGFVHPLVRDVIYHDLPFGQRELQHGRAARMLSEMGAPPEQVASHLHVVSRRGDEWVVAQLEAAAGDAMSKGAPESAAANLRRAIEEPPSPEQKPHLLFARGVAEMLSRGPDSVEYLREAYRTLPDPVSRAFVAEILARALLFTGDPREGADLAEEAAAALPAEAGDLRERLEAFLLVSVWFGAREPSTLEGLDGLHSVEPDAPAGPKLKAALSALHSLYSGGPANEAADLALQSLAGGELMAADPGLIMFGAVNTLVAADRPESLDASATHVADAYQTGSLFSMSGIHLWRGWTHLWQGEVTEAEDMLNTAFDSHERWGYGPNAHIYTAAFMCQVLVARGELDRARRALARSFDPENGSDGARWWLNARTELLVAEERYEEAVEAAEEIEARYPHWSYPPMSAWRYLKAIALHRLGRSDEAVATADEELRLARASGAPSALGRALRVLGTLQGEEGFASLYEACDVLEGTLARLEYAKAVAALGSAMRRTGMAEEAATELSRALEMANVCGAYGLSKEIRAELVASGVQPSIKAPTGLGSLTESERRVATLAARGQSGREIAQALYVTPNTVDLQLGGVFRKLGVSSREELAGALTGG